MMTMLMEEMIDKAHTKMEVREEGVVERDVF